MTKATKIHIQSVVDWDMSGAVAIMVDWGAEADRSKAGSMLEDSDRSYDWGLFGE